MSTIPGQDSKDKGNAAFKNGDFPTAIGHYTAAVLADPKNPTYTLNRAAAYLKLGKHADAERDCDLTIKLDQKNVKAWFRRGQARVGQDKVEEAQADFQTVVQLDPKNDAAKQELAKIESLLQYRASNSNKKRTPLEVNGPPLSKPSSQPASSSSTTPAAPPKRRRVPIRIVDTSSSSAASTSAPIADTSRAATSSAGSSAPSAADDLMRPISTRTLTEGNSAASSSPAPAPSTSKSPSFKKLKQSREANKTSAASGATTTVTPPLASLPTPSARRVGAGGGIFRSNGKHTIFSSSSQGTSVPKSQPSSVPKATPTQSTAFPEINGLSSSTSSSQTPLTLVNFTRAWTGLTSPEDRWQFLLDNVPPAVLPSMFKTSLEAPMLISLLETFKYKLANAGLELESVVKESVRAYMLNLGRVQRFGTVVLFMSRDEKKLVKDVWDSLNHRAGEDGAARKVWGIS